MDTALTHEVGYAEAGADRVPGLRAPLDGAAILANARSVAPVLREEADEGERRRRLTPRAVDALRSAGAFRMARPRMWGGPEVDPLTQAEVFETLAQADGSAGWCAMIGGAGGYFTTFLDDGVGRALYRDPDTVMAGWVVPAGQLHPTDGGYRLSGRWSFGSGCTHADVMIAGAVVVNGGGEPVIGPDGLPQTRIAMLPVDQCEILDTWHTTGLAASGSHDYTVHDVFVPRERTFWWGEGGRDGPLYAWPGLLLTGHLGVPLGIARAAVEASETVVAGKVLMPEMRPARDEPRVRATVARAEALIGSARSYAYDVAGGFWDTLVAGNEPSHRQRAALAGAYVHTVRTCRDAAELLADALGTASVFRTCPLERHRRDLATIAQHITAQPRFLETVGALWIDGATLDHPLLNDRVL
jgi:alkylation response protein AidB-like acyl-CoA dehydrogenase